MNSSKNFTEICQEGYNMKTIQSELQLIVGDYCITYENSFTTKMIDSSQNYSNKLEIKNHLCEESDQKLKKGTDIFYKNKSFHLQDKFYVQNGDSQKIQKVLNQKKIEEKCVSTGETQPSQKKEQIKRKDQIFKKSSLNLNFINRKTSKNIVKNFCKRFLSYLHGETLPKEKAKEAIQKFKEFNNSQKYNNKVLSEIVNEKITCKFFKLFLEEHAINWINNSKINDKEAHLQAIKIYSELCEQNETQKNEQPSRIQNEEEMRDINIFKQGSYV